VSNESARWVHHTHEVLDDLQELRFAIKSMESSSRSYVLTGDESDLKSYRASLALAKKYGETIRRATRDNPAQQREFPTLDALITQRIRFAEFLFGVRETEGMAAAAAQFQNGRDEQISNAFYAEVGRMQSEELRLLRLRDAEANWRLGETKSVLLLGTILGLLITAAAGWSVHRDHARRALADKALGEGEELYRMLLSEVRDYAILMLDPRGRIMTWSAGAERIKGYSAAEIIDQDFAGSFPPKEIAQGRPQEVLRMAAANGRYEEQGLRVRKGGSNFLASVTLTALRDPTGKLRGFSEITRDLSAAKESEARYRGLMEAAPDAMVVVDQGGDIVLLNVQAEKQFGYRRDELLGQKVTNIIPIGFAERLAADGLRSAEDALAQQIGTGIELSGRRRDGSEFPIELMLSPLKSTEGTLVTAAIRDISVRKAAEADLLQNVQDLNRSNQELEQFANIASHDLQEPLRMVASYTQLLSRRYKGKLDADADEFIAYAVDGASRMQRLIQDLLAYSRVGSKAGNLHDISSENALRQALQNLRGVIQDSGALVTHDPLPSVMADEIQLIQLFQNLVGNAIKYQRPGTPRVQIAAVHSERKWTFSVQDNGLGIESQYFERIFGMFQRLHKREEFAGTGIGLAICKKIVERHGGRISVESQIGQGSTFRFSLAEGKVS
jgi:PAS domain S-box-containing protein